MINFLGIHMLGAFLFFKILYRNIDIEKEFLIMNKIKKIDVFDRPKFCGYEIEIDEFTLLTSSPAFRPGIPISNMYYRRVPDSVGA